MRLVCESAKTGVLWDKRVKFQTLIEQTQTKVEKYTLNEMNTEKLS